MLCHIMIIQDGIQYPSSQYSQIIKIYYSIISEKKKLKLYEFLYGLYIEITGTENIQQIAGKFHLENIFNN